MIMMGFLRLRIWLIALTICFASALTAPYANAAVLRIAPATGTFAIGSTFTASIFLDTQNETVNALEIILRFPPDKLQVVSSSTGQSIIGIWTAQPSFNNSTGEIRLQGGIPDGINVSQGLITTITFRARQTGQVILRFDGDSKVLAHDGKGTDILRDAQGAIYQLTLPAPAGPIVISDTHPDQTRWYANPNVVLRWEKLAGTTAYSYILNREPVDIPDDIPEGSRENVVYRNLSDGQYYFHIKAMREGIWGGVTHFAINIDTTPPADFPIEIIPAARTTRRQPVIQWNTTDSHSGINHYEIALIPLSKPGGVPSDQPFFIEARSPYIPPALEIGNYDVIVRAYDNAGNYREVTRRIAIVTAVFRFIRESGIEFRTGFIVTWPWVWGIGMLILAGLGWLTWHFRIQHARLSQRLAAKEFPPHLKADLEELKKYREKYGRLMAILLLAGSLWVTNMGYSKPILAQQQLEFGPPIITSISRDITNKDIFYIGGKTETPSSEVWLYLQNLRTGETQRFSVNSDSRGDWFYRHHTFLSTGDYLIWTQSKVGDNLSPPGPQIRLTVRQTAFEIGATRISRETLYFGSTLLLFASFAILLSYTIFHAIHIRKKEKLLLKEIKEAEEALRRGFAVLRRDIEAELAVIRKARLSKELALEEKKREEELLRDLEKIESYIGKEIWDIEKAERVE
jgi:hypothetical protein